MNQEMTYIVTIINKRALPFIQEGEVFLFRPGHLIEFNEALIVNKEDDWFPTTLGLQNTWSYIEIHDRSNPLDFIDESFLQEAIEALRNRTITHFRGNPILKRVI